jgi:inhibitor of KinA sporulation pathway (predicted exonuclease)
VKYPKLSAFCRSLTGISQQQVDNGLTFTAALKAHSKWLSEQTKTTRQVNGQGAEVRVDVTDGGSYTEQEFVECYGGKTEWDAAENFNAKVLIVTCGDWDLKSCMPKQCQFSGTARGSF